LQALSGSRVSSDGRGEAKLEALLGEREALLGKG
jgi:hypothetical protein